MNLLEVDDDQDYAAYVKEQQAKAAKQRQQDEVNKPVKLSEFQCIICLDAPSDLTVTWCGELNIMHSHMSVIYIRMLT